MKIKENCLFFGFCLSEKLREELIDIDASPAYQTLNFGDSLFDLLSKTYDKVDCFSFSPVSAYPHARKILINPSHFKRGDSEFSVLPFINLPIIKHFSRFLSLILSFIFITREKKYHTVFIHGLHSPYIFFAAILKALNYKVGVVVTDESGVIRSCDGYLIRMLKSLDKKIVIKLLGGFDFGIALSKGLDNMYCNHMPSIIVPGIVNSRVLDIYSSTDQLSPYTTTGYFNVVYTGALEEVYGVKELVDSFCTIEERYVLHIFGSGSLEEYINEKSIIHNNLKFYGFKPASYLSKFIVNCDLLINPRPIDSNMSKMSFPSKLLEYALSGKPVLTTPLESIPEEIKDKFLYIGVDEENAITKSIYYVDSSPELKTIGGSLKSEVLQRYSVESISEKIKSLI